MILTFLSHQWKSFWRSGSAGKSLAAQLAIGFLFLYLLFCAAMLGFALPHVLPKIFPGQDITKVFCGLILYYFAMDLLMRFTFQDLPVLAVQPYLTENITRRQLVSFLNLRSLFSFFNLLPLLIFTPFAIITMAGTAGPLATAAFLVSILSLTAFNHFLILYIKRRTIIQAGWLIGFLLLIGAVMALDYFRIFSIRHGSALLFGQILAHPWLCAIPLVLGILAWINNSSFLRNNLYLEELSRSGKRRESTEYSWLQQWGLTGELMALDLRLILRNKRPRYVVTISLLMLLYGFVLYRPELLKTGNLSLILLAGLLMTGVFIINYGQFLFAWQSSHFDQLMAANIPVHTWLRSKLTIFIIVSTAAFAVSSFYGLMSWKIIPVQIAAWLYNIGVNSILALYFATRSYKAIDLSRGASFNYQGTGASQWFYTLLFILAPYALFWPLSKLVNPWCGIIAIGAIGLVALLLHNWLLGLVLAEFHKRKYLILQGFREK